MENKRNNVVPIWVSVILLVLSIVGTAYYGYVGVMMFPYVGLSIFTVAYFFGVLDAVLAMIYCLTGYKKSSAGIFKAYCISATISYILTTYTIAKGGTDGSTSYAITFFFSLIQCGLWFVLTIAKDLGKKKSLSICGILFIIQVITVLMNISYGISAMIIPIVTTINYIITYIMFYAKYKDKEARGTK